MRSPRIFTTQPLAVGQTVNLEKTSSHHLANVLRLQPGAEIILFNGKKGEYHGHLKTVQKNSVTVCILQGINISRESPLLITLAQGVSRGSRMDYTLQKSVELGVNEIIPLMTSRTQVKLDVKRLTKRMSHWEGIIQSASEQSGRTIIPKLQPCISLTDWCSTQNNFALKLVLDPTAQLTLPSIDKPEGKICILIGPEGGLNNEEIKHCLQQGFIGVALGPRILRTETAALVTLSAMQTLWGDFA
ncbi:MAG: 16S rRNA (uracil(1498)-N(3))-methyltransferase [Gammaproteobacteria bacterium]